MMSRWGGGKHGVGAGTVFLSISKALVDFGARGVPRAAVSTLGRMRGGNVGVVVTANEITASLNRLSTVPCSTIISLGNSRYLLHSNARVASHRVDRRSFEVIHGLTRGCNFPLTLRMSGKVFIGCMGSAIVTLSRLAGRPVPLIISVSGRFGRYGYHRLYVCYNRSMRGRVVARLPGLAISH